MTAFPVTKEQLVVILNALKNGKDKENAIQLTDELINKMENMDIDSIVSIAEKYGIDIKRQIESILKDKEYNWKDIDETIAIGKDVYHIIKTLGKAKGEIVEISYTEVMGLICSLLLLVEGEL